MEAFKLLRMRDEGVWPEAGMPVLCSISRIPELVLEYPPGAVVRPVVEGAGLLCFRDLASVFRALGWSPGPSQDPEGFWWVDIPFGRRAPRFVARVTIEPGPELPPFAGTLLGSDPRGNARRHWTRVSGCWTCDRTSPPLWPVGTVSAASVSMPPAPSDEWIREVRSMVERQQ